MAIDCVCSLASYGPAWSMRSCAVTWQEMAEGHRKFQELIEAYDFLADPVLRRAYDRKLDCKMVSGEYKELPKKKQMREYAGQRLKVRSDTTL